MTTKTDTEAQEREGQEPVGGEAVRQREVDEPREWGIPEPEGGYGSWARSKRFRALLDLYGALSTARCECFRSDKPAFDAVLAAMIEVDPKIGFMIYPEAFDAGAHDARRGVGL